MTEQPGEQVERQSEVLDRVLCRMKELHAESALEKSDEARISEGMSNQILGHTTQRAHQALLEEEFRLLEQQALLEEWGTDQLEREMTSVRLSVASDMFREHWFESTLSTADNPIQASTYGASMFRYDLRMLTAEHPTPERLKEFGWIMFDVNGLRSFKDCTSHAHTTQFLRGIARILLDPVGPTNKRLQENGVCVIPMAAGGDEFVLYLRANAPLTQSFIDEIIHSFQAEVSESIHLRSFLNFDDDEVLIKYGLPSSRQRKKFHALSAVKQREKLDGIRRSLPDTFIPSFSGGGALLEDGIMSAVEKDAHDLQSEDETFSTLREKIVQSTIDLAEERQEQNKEAGMRELEEYDPKRRAFQHRNEENRRLLEKNRALRTDNASLTKLLTATRAQVAELLREKTSEEKE